MEGYERYVGQVLDNRYRIERIIGMGGMAVVFRAEDLLMRRIVAVKILKDDIARDEVSVKRFINESKAVSMLSHPNIVTIYDVSVRSDAKYIVMEYIEGITLKNYMTKKGKLEFREIIMYTEQVLRALEHAHQKGIVHRDIKPQNIMLLKNGIIKVMDFGIILDQRKIRRLQNTEPDSFQDCVSKSIGAGGFQIGHCPVQNCPPQAVFLLILPNAVELLLQRLYQLRLHVSVIHHFHNADADPRIGPAPLAADMLSDLLVPAMIEQAVRVLKHTNMNGKLLHCFFDVCGISGQLSHVCQIQPRHEYSVRPHLSAKLGKRICVDDRSIFQARRVMEQEIRLLNHKVKKAFLIRLLVHLADSDTGNRRVDCVLETLFPKSALHPFLQEG